MVVGKACCSTKGGLSHVNTHRVWGVYCLLFVCVYVPTSPPLCSGCLVLVVSGPTQYTSKRVNNWRSLHTSQPKAFVDASWQRAFLQSMNFTPSASITCDDGDSAWKVSVQSSVFSNCFIAFVISTVWDYLLLFMRTYTVSTCTPSVRIYLCIVYVCIHVHQTRLWGSGYSTVEQ